MEIIPCKPQHAEAIQEIFNESIRNSKAIYEHEPRTLVWVQDLIEFKKNKELPFIGFEDEAGKLIAFATYGRFRPHAAYRYTIEHSIYVATSHRGRGLGKRLLVALLDEARKGGYHSIIGVIDSTNLASIQLHLQLGFTLGGTLREVGHKFDQWLTVEFYQLIL